jgi:hypothetical protein
MEGTHQSLLLEASIALYVELVSLWLDGASMKHRTVFKGGIVQHCTWMLVSTHVIVASAVF